MQSLNQPLVNWHRLPDYLQDNEFIVGHYRPGHWTWQQIAFSLFRIHNETFQHMEPPSRLLGLPGPMLCHGSSGEKGDSGSCSPPRSEVADLRLLRRGNVLPSGFGSLPPPGMPALKPHSPSLAIRLRGNRGPDRHVVLSAGVTMASCAIPLWQNLYLWSISIFGLATICVSLMDFFQQIRFRTLRALVFTGLGGFGVVVVAHQAAMHFHIPMVQEALILDGLMGVTYLLGAALYATRVPERWIPGKFDLALNSHNVFHLCVSLAAYVHYEASLVFIRWRENETCPQH